MNNIKPATPDEDKKGLLSFDDIKLLLAIIFLVIVSFLPDEILIS